MFLCWVTCWRERDVSSFFPFAADSDFKEVTRASQDVPATTYQICFRKLSRKAPKVYVQHHIKDVGSTSLCNVSDVLLQQANGICHQVAATKSATHHVPPIGMSVCLWRSQFSRAHQKPFRECCHRGLQSVAERTRQGHEGSQTLNPKPSTSCQDKPRLGPVPARAQN